MMFGASPVLQHLRDLTDAVASRALAERRRQLEASVPMNNLLAMEVSADELNAWVGMHHAPYAFGLPLRADYTVG